MKNDKQQREPIEFRTTYLSKIGIRTLAEHALGLPTTNPARATITGLVKRWTRDGMAVEFTEDGELVTPVYRSTLIEWLANGDDEQVIANLRTLYGITDEEIAEATIEAVMEEAA